MNDIPKARVVRGDGTDETETRPEGAVDEAARIVRRLGLAPREVPRRLVWRLLFGGWIATFGWVFATFGMVFVLVFTTQADFGLTSYDRQANATITGVEEANASENKQPIYRVRYTFTDEAGIERTGASYTKAPTVAGTWPVDYQSGEPSTSQLAGMRRQKFHWAVALIPLVFPIVGVILAMRQLRQGRRALHLLRHGIETRGKLTGKKPTLVRINNAPIMALTFAYDVAGKPYTTTVKTLSPGVLEDDELEAMLYDPGDPARATTLDHLPGAPRVTADGELAFDKGLGFPLLVLPTAFITLVVAAVYVMATR